MIKISCFFYTTFFLTSIFSFISLNAISQKFEFPKIPRFDSIDIHSYKGNILEKTYFLQGEKVFKIGYNNGSVLYTPFSAAVGAKEDSCYAYFNGKNHDEYDFYYISTSLIKNEKYSKTSNYKEYSMFNWNNLPVEYGKYYCPKGKFKISKDYKTGKWIKWDSIGETIETIDYDHYTINGKPIRFTGKLAIIDTLRSLTDKKIIEVYGKRFFSKYVRFNLDLSGYYTYTDLRPEQPGGYSLLRAADQDIYFVDLSYDIIIGDKHFNTIQFRVSNKGDFLGKTYFPNFVKNYFYLTQGLDSLNKGRFHKDVLNWKRIAKREGFDITSSDFNVKFEFKPTSNYYGELRMVIELESITMSKDNSFKYKHRQLIINPWTGEQKEINEEYGS